MEVAALAEDPAVTGQVPAEVELGHLGLDVALTSLRVGQLELDLLGIDRRLAVAGVRAD